MLNHFIPFILILAALAIISSTISPSCCNFGAQTSPASARCLVNRRPMPRLHGLPESRCARRHCHAYGTREQFFVTPEERITHGILIWSFRRCEDREALVADLCHKAAFQLCRGSATVAQLFGGIDDRLFAIELSPRRGGRTTGSMMLTRPCECTVR